MDWGFIEDVGLGIVTGGGYTIGKYVAKDAEVAANWLADTFKGPGTSNYRGDKLSDQMSDALAGLADPRQRASVLSNWLTGGKPRPVDIGVSLARSATLAGAEQRAGAGKGYAGAFGLGKILGFGLSTTPLAAFPSSSVGATPPGSPMQSGVPYSAVPVPDLTPKAGSR